MLSSNNRSDAQIDTKNPLVGYRALFSTLCLSRPRHNRTHLNRYHTPVSSSRHGVQLNIPPREIRCQVQPGTRRRRSLGACGLRLPRVLASSCQGMESRPLSLLVSSKLVCHSDRPVIGTNARYPVSHQAANSLHASWLTTTIINKERTLNMAEEIQASSVSISQIGRRLTALPLLHTACSTNPWTCMYTRELSCS